MSFVLQLKRLELPAKSWNRSTVMTNKIRHFDMIWLTWIDKQSWFCERNSLYNDVFCRRTEFKQCIELCSLTENHFLSLTQIISIKSIKFSTQCNSISFPLWISIVLIFFYGEQSSGKQNERRHVIWNEKPWSCTYSSRRIFPFFLSKRVNVFKIKCHIFALCKDQTF